MRERQTVLESDMRAPLACLIGAVSVVAVVFGPPASADDLKSVVRTLNAIVNPEDAWRLEDQARRHGRPKEEQRKRFLERIDESEKNWKFSLADFDERKFWKQYMKEARRA